MEANKEEAVRARELAEKKLVMGDYDGARKMALKAQRLYPDIENLSQLLVVCDVHCSAASKLNGSDSDWYAILQIARFSEEAVILKQYRKLAFSLHPDKNKYAGAEAAFKLIGEAKRELTDPKKRASFDAKCRGLGRSAVGPKVAANHMDSKASTTKPPAASQQNTRGHTYQQTQPERMGSHSHKQPQEQTFWTCCQSCRVKFQYYAQFLNKMLKCQNCHQHFVARDLVTAGGQPRPAYFGSASHQGVNVQGSGNVAPQSNGKSTFAGVDLRPDGGKATGVSGKSKSKEAKAGNAGGIYNYFKPQVKADDQVAAETGKQSAVDMRAAGKTSSKKRPCEESSSDDEFVAARLKRVREKKSSAGSGKEMEKPCDGGVLNKENSSGSASTVGDGNKEEPKQEPESVTEEILHRKKSRTEGIQATEDGASVSEKVEANGLDSGHETELGQEHIHCPDAEFTNFEEDKSEYCFKVNQVWALYDEKDSMPRFYARVKKILSPGFKLLITWLEACPGTEEEECWEDGDLPISCGTFQMGEPDKIGDRLMFSHQMDCRKGKRRGTYVIYPKKGETWALFKDWDIKWGSEPDKHKPPYCYDFVEILSDFTEESGIVVASLDKVKGFVSIFQRASRDKVTSFCIKPFELYRFSHCIPSRVMTGTERGGVPVGSFELDTAALPSSLYSRDDIKQAQAEEVHCSLKSDTAKYKKDPTSTSEEPCPSRTSEIIPEGSVVCGLSAGFPSDVHIEDNQGYADHFADKVANSAQEPQRYFDSKEKYKDVEHGEEPVSTPRRSTRGLRKGNSDADVNANRPVIVEGAKKRKDPSAGGNLAQPSGSESDSDFSIESRNKGGSSACPAGTPVSAGKWKIEAVKHDFNKERSAEKFKIGQVWAIFNKERMPKNYAVVKKIEYAPFTLHVAMLELPLYRIGNARPLSCGTFTEGKTTVVVSVAQFSHPVNARPTGKNRYLILPTEDEIWVVYKSPEWKQGEADDGECEIVKVLESKGEGIQVVSLMPLAKHSGLKCFYKAPKSKRLKVGEMEIPINEINRFSHRCAAYYHEGVMNGCWEVDASSVPSKVIDLD